MGRIKGLYLMPHPPIIIPHIGRGEEKKVQSTIDALETCAKEIKAKSPNTIIVITPHGPVFKDAIVVMMDDVLKGDMSRFGAYDIRFAFENNIELGRQILESARENRIPCLGMDNRVAMSYGVSTTLDWGALVPLYYVTKEYKDFKLVHITISFLPFEELYRFGNIIGEVIDDQDEDIVIIASGDLSHRLSEDGPYGFNPAGPKLDKAIIENLANGDVEGLMSLDPMLIEQGGECGLRSIIMGLGALKGKKLKTNILSYEGPFGVGYGVASIEGIEENDDIYNKGRNEDPYITLARKSLETYIRTGEIIEPDATLPDEMLNRRSGVFVTLKRDGQLRGCIGTIAPTQANIAEEIIQNAISAGTKDPRFYPVTEDELPYIEYSVDVLEEPEPVDSIEQLDAKKYGIIVKKGLRRGVLLPNLEGVDTPEEQLAIALSKAGIEPHENYKVERFKVIRHE